MLSNIVSSKIKLSHDPNNTRWTSDNQSFGHKIMSSHGWKPGEYLGAKDAPHAEFHTAANASHIRVSIKDDNLGLGAKIGSGVGHGECTGLDAFKNLLGRLNGKDEEDIEKEQKSRDDLKRAIYTERRWGSIRFVQGGFLVGDKIQALIDGEMERVRKLTTGDTESQSDSTDSDAEPEQVVEKSQKLKKRKLEELEAMPEVIAIKIKRSKKKQNSGGTSEYATEHTAAIDDVKLSKKKSKRRREAQTAVEDEDAMETNKPRKEKMDKKAKKEKKDKSKSAQKEGPTKLPRRKLGGKKKTGDPESLSESALTTRPTTKETTPSTPLDVDSGRSTPMLQGRHAVRSRNIAQKRLASMDVAALNQVNPPFSAHPFARH